MVATLDMDFEGGIEALVKFCDLACANLRGNEVVVADLEIIDEESCPHCKGDIVGINSTDGWEWKCERCEREYEYDDGVFTRVL